MKEDARNYGRIRDIVDMGLSVKIEPQTTSGYYAVTVDGLLTDTGHTVDKLFPGRTITECLQAAAKYCEEWEG